MGLFGGEISFNNLNVTGGLSVTGGITTDTISASSTLTVTGAATLKSTLAVTSTSSFAAKVTISAGGLSVVGGATVDTLSASSTLTVTGAATLKSTLAVTSTSSFAAKVTITAGGLAVTGGTTTDSLTASSTATFNGASTFGSSGSATFNGSMNLNGVITFGSSSSPTFNNGASFFGGITVDQINASGTIGISSPSNSLASFTFEFLNSIPTLRYGGSGTGSASGIQIAGTGDAVKWSVDNSGNVTNYGDLYVNGGNMTLYPGSGNASIEMGAKTVASTPYFDFHSSGNNIDYDARIIVSGGSSTIGNGTLTIEAGSFVVNAGIISNSESHLSSGTYADPQSGYTRGLKVSQGIATDYLYVSGAIHCESYLNNTGTYQVNSCPFIQMAYVTIPNNGSGGYKWTFPTAIPSSNGCQPIVTLNIVPGTQYFVNAGNNSRSGCTYYHSSSGSLSGWIFEVSQ